MNIYDFVNTWGWMILTLSVLLAVVSYILFVFPYQRKREQERETFSQLKAKTRKIFDVELENIDQEPVRKKVIETVNLLGRTAAVNCLMQNRYNRGEDVGTPRSFFGENHPNISWDESARRAKIAWAKARDIATMILLEHYKKMVPPGDPWNDMQHFSELEPLKSYNALTNKPGQAVRLKLLKRD
ncbi:MAG: hypothetical protein P4L63_03655 [Candidatus Pacebacteria bacterium]|nr:hypothetical protein [Candidatus Paceibacterota bacterium]